MKQTVLSVEHHGRTTEREVCIVCTHTHTHTHTPVKSQQHLLLQLLKWNHLDKSSSAVINKHLFRETYCSRRSHQVQDWRLRWSPPLCSVTQTHILMDEYHLQSSVFLFITILLWPRHHSCSPGRVSERHQSRTPVTVMSLPLACWAGAAALWAWRSNCRTSRCSGPASSPTGLRREGGTIRNVLMRYSLLCWCTEKV